MIAGQNVPSGGKNKSDINVHVFIKNSTNVFLIRWDVIALYSLAEPTVGGKTPREEAMILELVQQGSA